MFSWLTLTCRTSTAPIHGQTISENQGVSTNAVLLSMRLGNLTAVMRNWEFLREPLNRAAPRMQSGCDAYHSILVDSYA